MAAPFDAPELLAALIERTHPSITTFGRLEGRPRSSDVTRSLSAEVRDALWFLTRQWQLGEFTASDAGSPVLARFVADVTPLVTYGPGDTPRSDYDVTGLPLEALVERRPRPETLDLRLAAGRRWLRAVAGIGDFERVFLEHFPVADCDPDSAADAGVCAHPGARQQVAAVAGHAVDGLELAAQLARDAEAVIDAVGPTPDQRTALLTAAQRFLRWVARLVPGPDDGEDSWEPAALEYRFALGAGDGTVLRAEGYRGGRLDWSDVDVSATRTEPADPPATPLVRTVVPTAVTFAGMPHPRWWTFEDGRTDLGGIRANTTDLGRLLLTEFSLVYANDWFAIPLTVPDASLLTVRGLAVTTVFGERFLVEPAGSGAGETWQRWGMFRLTRADGATDVRLLVPPTLAQVQEGPVLEDVALVRDEMANLVWAIESRVPLPDGGSAPGREAADETRAFFERLARAAPGASDPEPAAPVRYRLASPVPENWIPFVAVHAPDSDRDVQLQRATLPRLIDGGPQPPDLVHPRTSLLRYGLDAGRPFFVHEEEAPRSGSRVTLRYQRARWYDGRVVVWLAARRETGRGEGSSGLRFDSLIDLPGGKA
jgi:hypothetical protein